VKIAILSRKLSYYSTRRIRDVAKERGHAVRVVDYLKCNVRTGGPAPGVTIHGRSLGELDAVVPRIAARHTFYGTAVVRQLELAGVHAANGCDAILRARDKLACLQLLQRAGVQQPRTGFAHSEKDTRELIAWLGGPPVVVKLVEGTQGLGVALAESERAAESVISAFRELKADILVQEFIAESSGRDLRALVVDGTVVAAMERIAPDGEFRANFHRGGTVQPAALSDAEHDAAVRAAQVTGLQVAGVDLLRSARGPLVMEVNASPGLEGIEQSTGVDVAGAVVDALERSVPDA
jgi:ribosomal protein S6--L-glutamate ligase